MKKRIVSTMLAAVLLSGTATALISLFSACSESVGTQKKIEIADADFHVWTMPSVERVLRDLDYSQYYTDAPVLQYEAARNEYESAQILFNTESDIRWYDLKVRDLVSANEERIYAADMDVYNQYYTQLKVLTKRDSGRPLGYYPDALVPMKYAKLAGENSFEVEDGKSRNQGLWVRVKTRKDTPAGLYKGKFTLTVNNESVDIPVSFEVYDFTLTDANHLKSSFHLAQEYIAGGQRDNRNETYSAIVEQLLDYRISTDVPTYEVISDEDYVREMKKFAADIRCSAYNVPTLERIKLLVENSTPELNLLKKAYMYILDEPDNDANNREKNLARAERMNKETIDGLIALANSYKIEELDSFGLTRADIEKVEVLITLTASNSTIEGLRTWCPLVSDYDTQAMRDKYAEFRESAYKGANNELEGTDYGTTWFYYCVNPKEPYANVNLDMDLVAARAVSWMQYSYDVEGQLYWGSAYYCETDTMFDYTNGWVSVDVYERLFSNGLANGDGYLLYPGMKYGVNEFFPSMRLEVLRDGFEDYEYLYELEERMTEYANQYGVSSFDFNKMMKSLYDSVFTGAVAHTDFNRVLEAKRVVASMIELISSNAHAIVEIGDVDISSVSIPFTVYAKSGTKLEINGTTYEGVLSGKGVKFTAVKELTEIANWLELTFINGEIRNTFTRYLSPKISAVSQFNDESDLAKWTASERLSGDDRKHIYLSLNTDPDFVYEGAGSMKVEFKVCEWTGNESVDGYMPHVSIEKDEIVQGQSFKALDYIEFAVYNAGEAFTLTVDLEATDGNRTRTKPYASYRLKSGWNVIRLTGFEQFGWVVNGTDLMDKITAIRFGVPRDEKDRTLYFDNVYCAYVNE